MTFDTLSTARALKEVGFEERQAEAIAEAIRSIQGELATKADITTLRTEIKTELAAVKWILGFMSAFMLAILARVFHVL